MHTKNQLVRLPGSALKVYEGGVHHGYKVGGPTNNLVTLNLRLGWVEAVTILFCYTISVSVLVVVLGGMGRVR